jgi:hypothetical protein
VYDVDRTIKVEHADTIVLGLGFATLTARSGAVAMSVADVRGVDIAGLVLDAGPMESPVLLRIGAGHRRGGPHRPSTADPTALQDVFFRVGGPHVGRARVSLEVNGDHTILDDIWAWRADHGDGVGWSRSTADNGVVVNGDDVTATGLFVEHFQRYGTVWNGERGTTGEHARPHDGLAERHELHRPRHRRDGQAGDPERPGTQHGGGLAGALRAAVAARPVDDRRRRERRRHGPGSDQSAPGQRRPSRRRRS